MLLSPLNDDGAVMEIRRNILDGAPAWIISLGKERELHIHRGEDEKALVTLCADGTIRMGDNGKVKLQVNGSVQADSFVGGYMQERFPLTDCGMILEGWNMVVWLTILWQLAD